MIDEDTEGGLDMCVLEWNATALPKFQESKLGYIAGLLLDKGIVPVFLILARRENFRVDRECDKQVKKICAENIGNRGHPLKGSLSRHIYPH